MQAYLLQLSISLRCETRLSIELKLFGCIRFNPNRWFSAKVILVKQKIIKITLTEDHRLRFDIFEYASLCGIRPKQDWRLIFKKVRRPRRFTKSSCCLGHLTYENYLAKLNVESLEERRLHADLLYVYKVLNNNVGINPASIGLWHCIASNSRCRR